MRRLFEDDDREEEGDDQKDHGNQRDSQAYVFPLFTHDSRLKLKTKNFTETLGKKQTDDRKEKI